MSLKRAWPYFLTSLILLALVLLCVVGIKQRERIAYPPEGVTQLCCCRNTLVTAGDAVTIRLWDMQSHLPLSSYRLTEHGYNSIVLALDGKTLFVAADDLNYRSPSLISTLENEERRIRVVGIESETVETKTVPYCVERIALSDSQKYLATTGKNGEVSIWSISPWKRVYDIRLDDRATDVKFLDDNQVIGGDAHGNYHVIRISGDKTSVTTERVATSPITCINHLPSAVLIGCEDGNLVQIDRANGSKRKSGISGAMITCIEPVGAFRCIIGTKKSAYLGDGEIIIYDSIICETRVIRQSTPIGTHWLAYMAEGHKLVYSTGTAGVFVIDLDKYEQ